MLSRRSPNEILSDLVKSWFKVNVIENAFKGLQKDLFGENGKGGIFGTNNKLAKRTLQRLQVDIMSAQDTITSSTSKLQELYDALKARE